MNNIQSIRTVYSNTLVNEELFDLNQMKEEHMKFDLKEIEKTKETIQKCCCCLEFGCDPNLTASYQFLRKLLSNQEKACEVRYNPQN